VRRFVNTVNLESGGDLLGTPRELARWLEAEGWGRTRASGAELAEAHRLRDVLRRLAVAHRDRRDDPGALEELDRLAAGVVVRIGFAPSLRIGGVGRGWPAARADLVAAVALAGRDGTWSRLTACGNPHCRWVVYDHSKNRSVRWCSERACGSRARARAYRARRAGR
jgi:predicted RNA-binding Zn ribbon-like protein